MSRPVILIIAVVAAAALSLFALNQMFPGALAGEGARMRLVYLLVLLAALLTWGVGGRGMLSREGARNGAIWVAIGLILLGIYTFKDDLGFIAGRMGAELTPTAPISHSAGAVELRRAENGHFIADAEVEGPGGRVQIRFLVDTGASLAALSAADARRLGFNVDQLTYNVPVNTANGRAFAANVTLEAVRLGDIELHDVRASVQRDGLDQSLLGMSFLNRLSGVTVEDDRMVLRQDG